MAAEIICALSLQLNASRDIVQVYANYDHHEAFCFSHCSGVRVFIWKACIVFNSSSKMEFTSLEHTNIQINVAECIIV